MAQKNSLTKEGRRVVTMAKRGLKKRQASRDKNANMDRRKRISDSHKRSLMKMTNWKCHVCGRRIIQISNVDIDHIRPRMHGGQDRVGNYLACCKRCNGLRGRLHYSEIQEALAFGKWALQEIKKETSVGIELANLYGKKWVDQVNKREAFKRKRRHGNSS